MDKRIALIDMGTNTFHLQITEVGAAGALTDLVKIKVPVRLGQGGISSGAIAPAAYARALDTLQDFRRQMEEHQVRVVRAMATSMVRNAANGEAFVQDILQQTGIQVEVIDGDREAELIYYGVRAAGVLDEATSLVIDIGGGSVEFIICNVHQIFWKKSFEIGAQRLMDKFFQQDPISANSIAAEKAFLQEKLQPLSEAIAIHRPTVLVGSSGTFDTLCDIDAQSKGNTWRKEASPPPASALAVADFYQIYHQLLTKNHTQRLAIPGMLEMRVDMIVVAGIVIDFVLQQYQLNEIRVSAYALKEGVLDLILSE
ncbi:phosphatase [Pontibacter qinzhouensis]|uniref:Phosphatase n=1 Tax=Pontibacter qinzhouensis TaxID=2603253 RepID=A0A5C8KEK3_9BACT|nr:phosphatase [Pontibacter qinzhouensis]TXK50864.1 phosphatase [Pontibacter qinzhouensis]